MIEKILKYNLCIGCGLCASVLGRNKCTMRLNEKGFYEPDLSNELTSSEEKIVKKLCPGIHVKGDKSHGVWGKCLQIKESWAADDEIRHKAASGGVVTSIAIYLLEQQKVNAVLQVGVCDNSYLFNELKISRTREDVLRNAQSRYAPVALLSHIKQVFEESEDIYAFIGKPCDIAAMKNFIRCNPQYEKRIKLYVSIFCAGMPGYNATIKAWKLSGKSEEPCKLKYRGDGWPGNFCANWEDGSSFQLTYDESWGKILGRDLGFRCKICPDGIGMLADISVGDSWNTKNGYPDFTESKGKCFVMLRSMSGNLLFEEAEHLKYVVSQPLEISKIKEMQPYQYGRRKLIGWRLLPLQILTGGLLSFKGLNIIRQALTANPKSALGNIWGSLKRIITNNGK